MLIHLQRHPLAILAAALVFEFSPAFASPDATDDKASEYNQVRKIAMRDPKVRAAFDKAAEKLDRKIIEIDPSLKSYVEKNRFSSRATEPAPPATPPATRRSTSHVVVKGETLSSIAKRYKTSVARLKSANHITDERKLKVGQRLVIPSASGSATSPTGEHATWGKIKPDF